MRLALLAFALALAACADPPPATPTLTVRAVFVQPMYGGEAALVRHEAIPDRMPAMRMALRVAGPDLFEGVAPGAPVALTLDSLTLEVLSVAPLPAGVALALESDEAGGLSFDPDDLTP